MKSDKDQPLKCTVEGDELVIRIGVSTLAFAFKESSLNSPFNEEANDWLPLWKVVDEGIEECELPTNAHSNS